MLSPLELLRQPLRSRVHRARHAARRTGVSRKIPGESSDPLRDSSDGKSTPIPSTLVRQVPILILQPLVKTPSAWHPIPHPAPVTSPWRTARAG